MDDVDRAQIVEERHLAAALERAAALARTTLGHAPTSSRCEDCDGEVEPARLAHGFSRCFACADWRERWQRQWGAP
jgi:RNA polymerase-binding transcription factor DksA